MVAFDTGDVFEALDNAESLTGFKLSTLGFGLAGFIAGVLISLRVLGGSELSTGRAAKSTVLFMVVVNEQRQ